MTTAAIKPGECHPYFMNYIRIVDEQHSISQALSHSMQETLSNFKKLTLEQQSYRYETSKWTPKEVMAHLIDTERIFCYRALRFARKDINTPLPGFEQNDYVDYADASSRSLQSLLDEYESVRISTAHFFNALSDEALLRSGKASDNAISVRALAFLIAGHNLHHIKLLQDHYLKA